MYKCECGREFSKKASLATHWSHCKLNPNQRTYEGLVAWNKGLNASIDDRVTRNGKRISEAMNHQYTFQNLDEESRSEIFSKISDSMKVAHSEGRAHNIGECRWNNEPSYPERFFMGVIENEFLDKNYTREYSVSRYSIDFAWVDKKLAIEIDGQQHDREPYKTRDARKDALLTSLGWKVLRIRWVDMYHDTKHWIEIAKNFIDSTN